jgi:hypothetical protein
LDLTFSSCKGRFRCSKMRSEAFELSSFIFRSSSLPLTKKVKWAKRLGSQW